MPIYNVSGESLNNVFDASGVNLDYAYDINGNIVFEPFIDEITYETLRDTDTGTTYYVTRIPKVRPNGQKQYPFVYCPYGTESATQSTLQMNLAKGFRVATNGGRFFTSAVGNNKRRTPIGTTIQNGVVIRQGSAETFWTDQLDYQCRVLTVDSNGDLGYADPLVDANELVTNGIVSALHGFAPVVINGKDAREVIESTYLSDVQDAQRQTIGQFENGDYCIITAEGRGYQNSVGWSIAHIIQVCLNLGLKFAFSLDGGGSTETVIGSEQINTIYEGTYGRIVPTYIVFNGTDRFFVPSEVTIS